MKFYTACQAFKEESGGVTRRGKGFARWMCQPCAERKTESIYKAKVATRPETLAKVRAMLYGKAA